MIGRTNSQQKRAWFESSQKVLHFYYYTA